MAQQSWANQAYQEERGSLRERERKRKKMANPNQQAH
jgi:hypothetical protein